MQVNRAGPALRRPPVDEARRRQSSPPAYNADFIGCRGWLLGDGEWQALESRTAAVREELAGLEPALATAHAALRRLQAEASATPKEPPGGEPPDAVPPGAAEVDAALGRTVKGATAEQRGPGAPAAEAAAEQRGPGAPTAEAAAEQQDPGAPMAEAAAEHRAAGRRHEEAMCRLGDGLRRLGMLREAEDVLTACLRRHPKSHGARWCRHLVHLVRGALPEALADVQAGVQVRGDYRGHRALADLAFAAGDMETAADAYDLALVFNGKDPSAYHRKAQALLALGRREAACLDLLLCLELAPGNADASRLYSRLLFDEGQYAKAIAQCSKHIALCPEEAEAYLHRGLAAARTGQARQAVLDLTQCVQLDPQCARAFFHRGVLLADANPRRALRDLSVCLLLDDTPAASVLVYLQRGLVYMRMRKFAEAVPDLFAALRCEDLRRMKKIASSPGGEDRSASPSTVCALYNLGVIHMRHLKKIAAAIKYFSRAVRADPTCVQGFVARAECYHLLHGQGAAHQATASHDALWGAFRDYSRAIRLRPAVPQYRLLCGKVALDLGQLTISTRLLQQAAALDPDLGQAAAVRAMVQSYLGKHGDAIEALMHLVFAHHAGPTDRRGRTLADLVHLYPPPVHSAAQRKGVSLLGEALLKAGRTNDALVVFDYLIRAGGGSASAFFNLGMCCVSGGDDELAVEAFTCALRHAGSHSRALYQRGVCRLRLKRGRGLADVNKALGIQPRMWQAYLTRASHFADQGKYAKAILNCNEALKLQPASVRALVTRGCLKTLNKSHSVAQGDFQAALDVAPTSSLALFNRGVCQQAAGDLGAAIASYSEVLAGQSGGNHVVHLNRAIASYYHGAFGAALEDLEGLLRAPEMGGNVRLLHTIGLCRHKCGDAGGAVAAYSDALRLDPQFIEAYIGRGNACTDLPDEQHGLEMAVRDFARAIHLLPTCQPAYVNMAYAMQHQGHLRRAFAMLSHGLGFSPDSVMLREARGVVNLQLSRFDAAVGDFSRAIAVEPSAELHNNRGVAHVYAGSKGSAARDFQAAVKLDPGMGMAHSNLAALYAGHGQLQQALRHHDLACTAAAAASAPDEEFLMGRALTKVRMKELAGARADMQEARRLAPDWEVAAYNLGKLQLQLGEAEEAHTLLSAYLAAAPRDPNGYRVRAQALGQLGRQEEAVDDHFMATLAGV